MTQRKVISSFAIQSNLELLGARTAPGGKTEIVSLFAPLSDPEGGGVLSWLSQTGHDVVFQTLSQISESPIQMAQLNQLLLLSGETPVTQGFFNYYWTEVPSHPYDLQSVDGFDPSFKEAPAIRSLAHLKWGVQRIYLDSLLYFGNIRAGFKSLGGKSRDQLGQFFESKRFDTKKMRERGPALPLHEIPKEDRHYISEMRFAIFGEDPDSTSQLKPMLTSAYRRAAMADRGQVSIDVLLSRAFLSKKEVSDAQLQMGRLSATDILDVEVGSQEDVLSAHKAIAERFLSAREAALGNTDLYVSLASELDVYMATSMRTKADFDRVSDACEQIFEAEVGQDLNLRYFNPTTSAAANSIDKGIIENLMVSCAKALVYTVGEKDSFGKDVEAAMALTSGKPVIFLCDDEKKRGFFMDVHPLGRLMHASTGVLNGIIVCRDEDEVSEVLGRTFSNQMAYKVEQSPKPGYFRVVDTLTGSTVRVQTNNKLLKDAFWNCFHPGQS
ncbi:MAG: hypothetical protein ACI9BD_001114 [Candidatus Marinamargulisbacteria bacterium]|jgi:hypothetical protein